ncbi:hypothetical protein HZC32_03135 [Candidatus Woesearchaeota archaeon]|nr:hypothetical protein [Candidatus Woesearchaeota archaeon]
MEHDLLKNKELIESIDTRFDELREIETKVEQITEGIVQKYFQKNYCSSEDDLVHTASHYIQSGLRYGGFKYGDELILLAGIGITLAEDSRFYFGNWLLLRPPSSEQEENVRKEVKEKRIPKIAEFIAIEDMETTRKVLYCELTWWKPSKRKGLGVKLDILKGRGEKVRKVDNFLEELIVHYRGELNKHYDHWYATRKVIKDFT